MLTKLLYALTAASAVSSIAIRQSPSVDTKFFGPASLDETAVGSVYFLSNDPSGNYVVSASINNNGLLTPSSAIWAQGTGGHGIPSPFAPGDPLFSQGPVAVSQTTGYVAAVNAGTNTVQLFAINPLIPSVLTPIGLSVPSAGEFPTSAAFNNAGDMLCVLTAGAGAAVRCYSVSAVSGLTIGSTRSMAMNTTTPPHGIPGSISTVGFTPDDSTVIAIAKGVTGVATNPSVFVSWNVTSSQTAALAQNGLHTPVSSEAALPFSITHIPGKNAFLSADSDHGIDIFDYSAGLGVGQVVSKTFNISAQGATCWSTYSSKSGNYYVADLGNNFVSEINISSNLTPSLVRSYPSPLSGGVNELAVASINGNEFLYALLSNATALGVMRIDGPGNASFIQTVDFSAPAAAANLSLLYTHVAGLGVYLK